MEEVDLAAEVVVEMVAVDSEAVVCACVAVSTPSSSGSANSASRLVAGIAIAPRTAPRDFGPARPVACLLCGFLKLLCDFCLFWARETALQFEN